MRNRSFLDPYPTRKWPKEVLEHEPAHGFFVRLAEECGVHSVRVLADLVGVNGRNFDLAEILELCLQYPTQNIAALREATPRVNGANVYLYGERFRKQLDWSSSYPRVCPGCLAESRHYRNWWDLWIIGTCPFHRMALTRGDDPDMLKWWYPGIGTTTGGKFLGVAASERYSEFPVNWENYVLGRLGVLPRARIEAIDEFDLASISEAAEILGRIEEGGWLASAPPRALRDSDHRRHQMQIGFAALAKGIEGIRDIARPFFAEGRRRGVVDGKDTYALYGWSMCAFRYMANPELGSTLIRAFDLELGALVAIPRSRKSRIVSGKVTISLNETATQLGITVRKCRELAVKLKLITPAQSRNSYYAITPTMMEEIASVIANLLSFENASQYLGITERDLSRIRQAGLVSPFIRWGRGVPWPNCYRKMDLDTLLDGLRSKMPSDVIPHGMLLTDYCAITGLEKGDVIVGAYSGKIGISGWINTDHTVNGMMVDMLSVARPDLPHRLRSVQATEKRLSPVDVAARLNMTSNGVRSLVRLGLLWKSKNSGRTPIEAESVSLFRKTYTTIWKCASATSVPASEIEAALAQACVFPLKGDGISRKLFVERAAAERVLGIVIGDENDSSTPQQKLWDALRHEFSQFGSTIRVFSENDAFSAMLRSGSRGTAAKVEIDPALRKLVFRVDCNTKSARVLYRSIEEKELELKAIWPTGVWQEFGAGDEIVISEELDLQVPLNECVPEVAAWIYQRITNLHLVLVETQSSHYQWRNTSRRFSRGTILHS